MPEIIYVHIVGESDTDIWGLSGRERLERMVAVLPHAMLVNNLTQIPAHASVLCLRADYVFDARVLVALAHMRTDLMLISDDGRPAALRIFDGDVSRLLADFINGGKGRECSTLIHYATSDLELLGIQKNLKKRDPPYVLPICKHTRQWLESELFARSYKGVTDLVTKWLWPIPAFWTTRLCVGLGLRPNHVTVLSLILAVLAGIAFWHADFGVGLVMGWLMTFLDTVDGKLARVTVSSSRIGDILDHGLDIIHPPLWYMAWAVGLASVSAQAPDLPVLFTLILIGYIGGRLCEGLFQFRIASFDIFIWRPLDSFSRLITARRNPNLILLTFGYFIGRPDVGLWSVIAWHLLSTLFLSVRVTMGWHSRQSHGPLRSWFEEVVPGRDDQKLAVRIFASPNMYKRL